LYQVPSSSALLWRLRDHGITFDQRWILDDAVATGVLPWFWLISSFVHVVYSLRCGSFEANFGRTWIEFWNRMEQIEGLMLL
jgi:hypothetical protein